MKSKIALIFQLEILETLDLSLCLIPYFYVVIALPCDRVPTALLLFMYLDVLPM